MREDQLRDPCVSRRLAALSGMLAAPLILVLLMTLLYSRFAGHPGVAGALRGMSAVAAGMIIAAGLKLSPALKSNPLPLPFSLAAASACFTSVALLRWPLGYTLLGLGPLSCALAYRRLKR